MYQKFGIKETTYIRNFRRAVKGQLPTGRWIKDGLFNVYAVKSLCKKLELRIKFKFHKHHCDTTLNLGIIVTHAGKDKPWLVESNPATQAKAMQAMLELHFIK